MKFILSFDCEGKWGVADKLSAFQHRSFTDENLRRAYRAVLGLLDEFRMPATMAFTGLWSLSRRTLDQMLEPYTRLMPHWVRPAAEDLRNGTKEGWIGDWAMQEALAAKTKHEIAMHGVTHAPWSIGEDLARAELKLFYELAPTLSKLAKTYIYPRNIVNHTNVLAEFGIEGYRAAPRKRSRAGNLLSQFDVRAQPEPEAVDGQPVRIPGEYMVNWRHGLRNVVPIALSIYRAELLIERAARRGGVVHFWTHPESVASAPQTLQVLRGIVERAARERDRGRIRVVTQAEYCGR